MQALGHVGPPNPQSGEDEYSMMHGLSQAIEALCEPSEAQMEKDQDLVENRGRIICLTSAKRWVWWV